MSLALLITLLACGSSDTRETTSNRTGTIAGTSTEDDIRIVAPQADEGIQLAAVGQGGVGSDVFMTAATRQLPQDGHTLTLEERRDILGDLVKEEVLWQEAARRGLYRDPKVRKIMVNLLLREQVFDQVRATDFTTEEIRGYFDENQSDFTVPEKLQIKRIFLAVGERRTQEEAMTLMRELHGKIRASPDKLAQLAQDHSEDQFRRRGGDMGYVPREGKPGVDPLVVSTAFALDVGQLSQPFLAGGGVNLVKVVNRRTEVKRDFEHLKGSVVRKLKNERYKDLTTSYIAEVMTGVEVTYDEEALAGLDLSTRMGHAGSAIDIPEAVDAPSIEED